MTSKGKLKKAKIHPISQLTKPAGMSLEEWQITIRRQTAKEDKFRFKNIGREPIFSSYNVLNPKTNGEYRVEIRGKKLGLNYCSCPDFSINTLGTCKHIEFLLHQLRLKKVSQEALRQGAVSRHSSVTLRYGLKGTVAKRPFYRHL